MAKTGESKVQSVAVALAKTRVLEAEEERVLRMRRGVKVAADEVLERVGQDDPDVAAELLLIEMELFRKARDRQAPAVTPVASRTKDKIVRALRRKP